MIKKKFFVAIFLLVILLLLIIYIIERKHSNTGDIINSVINYGEDITIKNEDVNTRGVANELLLAIEESFSWDKLAISNNFKSKFVNSKGIISDKSKYDSFHCGSTIGNNGEQLIVIYADKKEPIFDFDDTDAVTTEFYYKYKINDENELDDIELVSKKDVYSISGDEVK